MASTSKKDSKPCVGKDAFTRMNYLFQLSKLCATKEIGCAKQVANFYARQVIAISKKTVQRIEPRIKRRICKTCHSFLIPGKTCKVRVRKNAVVHKCLLCNREKRFMATPDYKLWIEQPEAIKEVFNYRGINEREQEPKEMPKLENKNPVAEMTVNSTVLENPPDSAS